MFCWSLDKSVPQELTYNQAVAFRHQVYAFGGNHYSEQIEVYVFNTVSLRWRKLTPGTPAGRTGNRGRTKGPATRWGHTAVLIEDTIYLWGGAGYEYCNVLYAFDIDAHTWFKPTVHGLTPKGRSYQSACVLGKDMIIHGGRMPAYTNDTYRLDTSTMIWTLVNARGTDPPATACHSATIVGTKMFVFGGDMYNQYFYSPNNTIRVFDTESNLWLDTPSAELGPKRRWDPKRRWGPKRHWGPKRRWGHSAFTYNGEMYVYGGATNGKYFNDLWKFTPETFSWKRVECNDSTSCRPPLVEGMSWRPITLGKDEGPAVMFGMCCCMVGDRIVFLGGNDSPYGLYFLDLCPSLKTSCKLAVIQYGLDHSGLPHDIRWELRGMTNNRKK